MLDLAFVRELDAADPEYVGKMFDRVTAQLNDEPDSPQLRCLYAMICVRAHHYGVAKAVLDGLLTTHGNQWPVRVANGVLLTGLGRYDEALRHYAAANKLAKATPGANSAMVYSNMAVAAIRNGDNDLAIGYAEQALELDPNMREAAITLGFGQLYRGELEAGWDNYERGYGILQRERIDYGVPLWRGEHGARLVIHGEQGIGDEIMYASCIGDVLDTLPEAVMLDCDPRLAALFRRSFGGIQVVGSRRSKTKPWLAEFRPTHSISIASLPVMYRRRREDFNPRPYLIPDGKLVAGYRAMVQHAAGSDKPICGLAWSGGSKDTKADLREIPMEAVKLIVDRWGGGYSFVSLQYRDDAQAQIEVSGLPIVHLPFITGKSLSASYDHTAALIAACDWIVATDTAAVHAAGALDVSTNCLLTTPSMWVHGEWQGAQSPWYATVLLHRKPAKTGWVDYIKQLIERNEL